MTGGCGPEHAMTSKKNNTFRLRSYSSICRIIIIVYVILFVDELEAVPACGRYLLQGSLSELSMAFQKCKPELKTILLLPCKE